MAYDVEMHEDDDFQKTLDMADDTKPKKVFQTFHCSLFDFFSKAKSHRSSMQNHSQNDLLLVLVVIEKEVILFL